jgi:hypothetical protein
MTGGEPLPIIFCFFFKIYITFKRFFVCIYFFISPKTLCAMYVDHFLSGGTKIANEWTNLPTVETSKN